LQPDFGQHNSTSTPCSQPLWGGVFHRLRTTPHLHQGQVLSGGNVDQNYFTIILQSSVGTLETVSESVCIGRNRCATYTNHVITICNHISKLAGL